VVAAGPTKPQYTYDYTTSHPRRWYDSEPLRENPKWRKLSRGHTILTSRELTSCQRCGAHTHTYRRVTLFRVSCLHNLLCKERNPPDEFELLCPRTSGLRNLQQLRRNAPRETTDVRDYFRDYFDSPVGSVPWQLAAVRRGRLHSP